MAPARARSGGAARGGLSRVQIAAAAVALADRDGIEAVSMRRVAAALAAGTMSLYRHVADREDLLDAMIEAVYAEAALPRPSGDWRRDVLGLARAQRALMRAHPWVAPLVGSRPPLLPGFLRSFELALSAFRSAGLAVGEAAAAASLVGAFVTGFALLEHAEDAAGQRTGLTREQWRLRNWPRVERLLAGGAYPAIAEFVADAPDADPDELFETGLRHLLDGRPATRPGAVDAGVVRPPPRA